MPEAITFMQDPFMLIVQKVQRLRAEFELLSPPSSSSSNPTSTSSEEWTAASELAEVEKLASLGILLQPRALPTRRSKLRVALANPTGRVVFAENRDEFYSVSATREGNAEAGPSRPRQLAGLGVGANGSGGEGEDGEGDGDGEEEMDLGWEDTPAEVKRKQQAQRDEESKGEMGEVDEEEQAEELRVSHVQVQTTFVAVCLMSRYPCHRDVSDNLADRTVHNWIDNTSIDISLKRLMTAGLSLIFTREAKLIHSNAA